MIGEKLEGVLMKYKYQSNYHKNREVILINGAIIELETSDDLEVSGNLVSIIRSDGFVEAFPSIQVSRIRYWINEYINSTN